MSQKDSVRVLKGEGFPFQHQIRAMKVSSPCQTYCIGSTYKCSSLCLYHLTQHHPPVCRRAFRTAARFLLYQADAVISLIVPPFQLTAIDAQ